MSTLTTPRQRGLQRPSAGNINTASTPTLRSSTTTIPSDVTRKTSMRTLGSNAQDPKTPGSGRMDVTDLEVGDMVNVPGEMYGTVKFVGSVRGKPGKFVGVELDREFAARGKNDGDVDGKHYFRTAIPGSGIFLPVHRAEKRQSPSMSVDSFPVTPNTPSYSTIGSRTVRDGEGMAPPTSTLKFSQSVGPGARPSSPNFKPKRPSLPRPESPLRRQAPNLAPTPARTLSASQRGTTSRPGMSATTPSKNNFRTSTTSRPSTAHSQAQQRPYSRTGSRLGHRADAANEDDRTPKGAASTRNGSTSSAFSQSRRPGSRLGSAGSQDAELDRLRLELAERDKRLAEQAANLADMEASVKELSAILPEAAGSRNPAFTEGTGDETAAQLRQMLREKNEKITILTSEFDAHRADFRSTLDSLEMASTETERVYEEQKRDLIAQVEELSVRCQELEEMNTNKKEFDDVARQLKQLEDFVQELEEGLEDARRGEAEARGEVEFLRGEVERGRSELKREREKAAATANGGSTSKELDQKEDEIRGLKAIIHSFSTSPDAGANGVKPPGEIQKLQDALSQSQKEKESLEHELEQLRRDSAMTNGHHTRNESEMTATANDASFSRPRGDTIKATFAEHAARRAGGQENTQPLPTARPTYCDMCESSDHDTLDCTHFQGAHDTSTEASNDKEEEFVEANDEPTLKPAPLMSPSIGKENEKKLETKVEDKWCALCEKDGHLAYECPDEQY